MRSEDGTAYSGCPWRVVGAVRRREAKVPASRPEKARAPATDGGGAGKFTMARNQKRSLSDPGLYPIKSGSDFIRIYLGPSHALNRVGSWNVISKF